MTRIYDYSDRVIAEGEGSVRDVLEAAVRHGTHLYGADLYGADLAGANLHSANLYCADLRGAVLRGAVLRSADLRGASLLRADLTDIAGHWHSHDVIAEVLRQAAGADLERRAFAGLVLVSRDWCWKKWTEIAEQHPQGQWARDVLRAAIVEGDATVPEVLR